MATTIQLKVKDQEGNVKTENREVEEITFKQFEDLMKEINEVIKEMRSQDSLKGFANAAFSGEMDLGNATGQEIMAKMDKDFLMNLVQSFESLSVLMPAKAREILSVLSDIDSELIKEQKMSAVLDIYDAILEENDIEKLISRVKKSLALTKTKMSFQNLIQKVTKRAAK
jgi:hypothetical protein